MSKNKRYVSPAWGAVAVFITLGVIFIQQSTTSIGGPWHLIISGIFFAGAISVSVVLIREIKGGISV